MRETVNTLFRTALPRYGKRSVFFLTIIAIPVLLILLGQSELLSVESEWAASSRIISQNGQLTGNYAEWHPENFSSAIFGKIVALLSKIVPMSEWILRIPSVLAALMLLSGTMVLALEVTERKTAVMTGWLLMGSYGFLYWGRVGSCQMFAAAALVWSAVLFYSRSNNTLFSFRRGLDFCFIFLLTLLACGRYYALGLIFFLLPQWFALAGKRKISLRDFFLAAAGGITATVTVLILLMAVAYVDCAAGNAKDHWQYIFYFIEQILLNSFPGSIYGFITSLNSDPLQAGKFLIHLPRLMLPWTLLAPAAYYGLWKRRDELSPEHKRLIYGILFYICMGIIPAPRWGAMLPVLGPALILLSLGFSAHFRHERLVEISERAVRGILIILSALVMALPCTYPLWEKLLQVSPPLLLFLLSALTGLVTLLILTYCIRRRNPAERIIKRHSPLAGTVLAGVCLSIFVNCVLFPEMSMFRTARNFWTASGRAIEHYDPAPECVVFYKMSIPDAAIFYLDLDIPFRVVSAEWEMNKLLKQHGGKIAVFSEKDPAVKNELLTIIQKNRRRLHENGAAVVEANPVAFIHADYRSADKNCVLWILEF